MASVPEPPTSEEPSLDLLARLRRLFWAASGMFSLASLSLAFTGYMGFGALESAATNFLAAIVSACAFGLASFLRFGPASA